MTWTSSGTTITQTGTDTDLSGLNGLAGITTTSFGYYTRYTLAANYNIIINGTLSFNTSTTLHQLYIQPNFTSTNIIRVNGSLTIGTNQNLYLQTFAINTPAILQEQALISTAAGANNDGQFTGTNYTTFWVAPSGTLRLYGSIISITGGMAVSATATEFTTIDSVIRCELIYLYKATTWTRTKFFSAFNSTTGSFAIINASTVYTGLETYKVQAFVSISNATPANSVHNFFSIPSLPSSVPLVGGGRLDTSRPTARFYNLALGSDYAFEFTISSPRYYFARLYQQIVLTAKNTAGTGVENALVRITGKSGSTTYDSTTNSSGVTPAIDVELALTTRTNNTGTTERYCVSNNTTDDFNIVIYSYAHLYAELPTQIFKSQTALALPWTLFTDTGVIQTNTATVAAYTGISVTSTLITVSQNNTLSQVYDFVKLAWRNNQYANRPIRSADFADFQAFNLTISGGTLSGSNPFTDGFSLTGSLAIASPTSYTGDFSKPSGNTVLQSNGTYTFRGFFASGTTITVASGSTSLENCEFSGTTINVSSGSATVTVAANQLSNVTAGSNVSIVAPQPTIAFENIPVTGTELRIYNPDTDPDTDLAGIESSTLTSHSLSYTPGSFTNIRVQILFPPGTYEEINLSLPAGTDQTIAVGSIAIADRNFLDPVN